MSLFDFKSCMAGVFLTAIVLFSTLTMSVEAVPALQPLSFRGSLIPQ